MPLKIVRKVDFVSRESYEPVHKVDGVGIAIGNSSGTG
jgi:hypothetical protein